jgi:uncharacterized protein YndB with AHSA1/START domain
MLVIALVFRASAEELFCAWTDPAIMSQWLFKGDNSEIESIDIDLSVGGRFSIVERAKDEIIDHFGNFLLVEKPQSLSFTLEVPKHFSGTSQVQIDFKQTDTGCEMVFQQAGVNPEIVEGSWRRMFSNLTMVLLRR